MPDLPPAVEVAAFRVATEALNNVVRHSRPAPRPCGCGSPTRLDVEVVDDGDGRRALAPRASGCRPMRERAVELGGSFEAGPPSRGGRVRATCPLGVA